MATPEAVAALPDRPGKAGIVQSCSGCHQPDIVLGQKRDAVAWRELVDQMIARLWGKSPSLSPEMKTVGHSRPFAA